MQISSINNNFTSTNSTSNLQDIMNNLDFSDKRILREALLTLDSKDLPKALKAMSKIPPDTDYLKNLLNVVEEFKKEKGGFSIYA